MLPVESPFKTFTGLDGKPLNNGYVYFGLPNQNPITAPVTVYWDIEGTMPAAQPLRTVNGYIVRAGTPANVFVEGAYSELVKDSKDRQVFYAGNSDSFSLSGILAALANFAASAGSSMVGFIASGFGAVKRTVQDKLRDHVNVRDFGAKGDGVTDDTLAIQNAINSLSFNGTVEFPAGAFVLSATLTTPPNVWLKGSGCNSTIFRRFSDYGHTVDMATAGASRITGIWMYHGQAQVPGDTTLTNRVTTATAHVRIANGQQVVIEDCWFWRMPYQITIDNASLVKIKRCNIQGTWDDRNVPLQEGIAGICVGRTGYTQIVVIEDCYFGGSGSAPESMTWTSSDTGAHTFTGIGRNIGNQIGIQIKRCEDLIIDGCYMGGNNHSNISATMVQGSANLDWRITNNFFDGAGSNMIEINPEADGVSVTGVAISDNIFNGELLTTNAMTFYNAYGFGPVITNFTITGNAIQAIVGSGILLYNVEGGVVSNNSIAAYNCRLVTLGGDPTYSAAIVSGVDTGYCHLVGNSFGGNPNGTPNASNCFLGHARVGRSNRVTEVGTVFKACGAGGNLFGRVDMQIVTVGAGNYQMWHSDELVIVKRPSPVAMQVLPPGLIAPGFKFTLKDGAGDAGSAPISFSGTVDGVNNPNYTTPYFSKTLMWNGTQWNAIG